MRLFSLACPRWPRVNWTVPPEVDLLQFPLQPPLNERPTSRPVRTTWPELIDCTWSESTCADDGSGICVDDPTCTVQFPLAQAWTLVPSEARGKPDEDPDDDPDDEQPLSVNPMVAANASKLTRAAGFIVSPTTGSRDMCPTPNSLTPVLVNVTWPAQPP